MDKPSERDYTSELLEFAYEPHEYTPELREYTPEPSPVVIPAAAIHVAADYAELTDDFLIESSK